MTNQPDEPDGICAHEAGPDDYRVGYKRPPLHSRFKTGQSGNPRGRPRGARNFRTILMDVAMRKTTVVRTGKRRRLTNLEHVIDAVRLRAARGDPIAMKLVMRYGMPQPDEEEFKIPKGVLIIGEKLTEEEWLAKCNEWAEREMPCDYRESTLAGESAPKAVSFDATPEIISRS